MPTKLPVWQEVSLPLQSWAQNQPPDLEAWACSRSSEGPFGCSNVSLPTCERDVGMSRPVSRSKAKIGAGACSRAWAGHSYFMHFFAARTGNWSPAVDAISHGILRLFGFLSCRNVYAVFSVSISLIACRELHSFSLFFVDSNFKTFVSFYRRVLLVSSSQCHCHKKRSSPGRVSHLDCVHGDTFWSTYS